MAFLWLIIDYLHKLVLSYWKYLQTLLWPLVENKCYSSYSGTRIRTITQKRGSFLLPEDDVKYQHYQWSLEFKVAHWNVYTGQPALALCKLLYDISASLLKLNQSWLVTTELSCRLKKKLLAIKHLVALRDCIFREPFPGNLAVAHINRSQKSSTRRTSTSEREKKN